MRRCLLSILVALAAFVAGVLTAGVARAQGLDDHAAIDSAMLARGVCRWAAHSEWPASGPLTTVLLDSAGIRVTEPWQGPGRRDAAGREWMCRTGEVRYTFAGAFASHALGDPPFIGLIPDSAGARFSCSRAGAACSPWPDSLTVWRLHAEGVWADWRRTTQRLAARYHAAAPPVVPPPVPPPATDPCAAAPTSWLPLTDGTVRRDEARLPRCAAVVLLDVPVTLRVVAATAPVRWAVVWPPCTGTAWRRHPTTYTTRTAALDRARRVPPCPAPRSN